MNKPEVKQEIKQLFKKLLKVSVCDEMEIAIPTCGTQVTYEGAPIIVPEMYKSFEKFCLENTT